MIFLAHPGHWLVQVAYFVPVLVFLAWLTFTTVRQRRRDGPGPTESSTLRSWKGLATCAARAGPFGVPGGSK